MTTHQTNTLRVPGATLAYQVRGSGPILLLIAGGDGGGEGYINLANALAEHYTVVCYDRRGAVGSTLDDPSADVLLETHTDDARRLLEAITREPAYVFGSSAGALVGLDFAMRCPQQVRLLVAHEPPVEGVLPEFDQMQEEIQGIFQQASGAQAMMKFMASLGVRYDDMEPGVEMPRRGPQDLDQRGNALVNYTFKAVHRYRLDLAALAQTPVKIVLAAGSEGQGTPIYRCATIIAERAGKAFVEFPSHHAGYVSHPRAFAARLHEILNGA